ncbi:helix-turn-helix domain-containing protein [Amnibacterium kyonggiense]|uniref:Helix-turn-helix protein n=1 Tax=Amnibacterium kyonggiense TaxID=595671 RepID=A0A4V6Q105_9MICO|nr:helix-turn-helix transcriptional regulator [Amnibacterium kyonggiense]TDS79694.1 helix-turn-helix protein [Amnibacterium kyonggiense]
MTGSPTPPPSAPRPVEPLWRHMLGNRLRRLRRDRGETLGETAGRAGISPQYLSEMERGAKDPSSEMIAAVAGALGVTLLDLTIAVAAELHAVGEQRTAHAPSRGAVALAA